MMLCKGVVVIFVDELLLVVKIVGVINVIVNDNGKLIGYIMDGIGFVCNLKENGVDIVGKKLVVIGVGGVVMVL